jgi:hypothetical protein
MTDTHSTPTVTPTVTPSTGLIVPRDIALRLLEWFMPQTRLILSDELMIGGTVTLPSFPVTSISWWGGGNAFIFTSPGDMRSAKVLRRVNKSLAAAYSPLDIYRIVGGAFGRSKYGYILRANSVLWNNMLRSERTMVFVRKTLARMSWMVNIDAAIYRRDKWAVFDATRYAWAMHRHRYVFLSEPRLMLNDRYVNYIISTYTGTIPGGLLRRFEPIMGRRVRNIYRCSCTTSMESDFRQVLL